MVFKAGSPEPTNIVIKADTVTEMIRMLHDFAVKMKGKEPDYILLSDHLRMRLRCEWSGGEMFKQHGMDLPDSFLGMQIVTVPFVHMDFLQLGYGKP